MGQQQRVMIAMAIACEPKLLIADELDHGPGCDYSKADSGLAVSAASASPVCRCCLLPMILALVGEIADQVIVMRHGKSVNRVRFERCWIGLRTCIPKPCCTAVHNCRMFSLRLPMISDFMKQDSSTWLEDIRLNTQLPQRSRGLKGGRGNYSGCTGSEKSFYSRKGLFGKDEFQAVKGVSFQLAKGKTLGLVGESGLGKPPSVCC